MKIGMIEEDEFASFLLNVIDDDGSFIMVARGTDPSSLIELAESENIELVSVPEAW